MVAGEHNIMCLAVKRLNQYDIRRETTDILGRQKWMRTAFINFVHTNTHRQLEPNLLTVQQKGVYHPCDWGSTGEPGQESSP